MQKIVLASGNKGKLNELQQLLINCDFEVVPQTQFNFAEAEETGLTFVENAILKARNAAKHTGLPAIADDSGLEVDALNGAPGIYSARYAGPNASDADNNQKLLKEISTVTESKRSARFQCLLVLVRHELDPTPIICQGTIEGKILFEPRGTNGFGYDPLFLIPEKNCSSAQLRPEVKNVISHRGKAMKQLLQKIQSEF